MNNQKHIVINAATSATGGGLIVSLDIIRALCKNPNYTNTLICPDINVYRKLTVNVRIIYVSKYFLKYYSRWWLDYIWLRKTIKKCKPDIIISLGNLPARTSVNQIMFNDNAFVSERSLKGFKLSFRELIAFSIRKWLFHKRIKFVNTLIVQNELEKNKFIKNYKKLPSIMTFAPLLPSHITIPEGLNKDLPVRKSQQVRLGCLSYIRGYKNIMILSDVLDVAEKEKFPLQIIFAIAPVNSSLSKKLIIKLKRHIDLGNAIIIGKVKSGQIGELVKKLDGLILPSLNESYGLNYIEAVYFKKPFLVSDRPFAREIYQDSAFYFNPILPESIFNTIVEVFSNKDKLKDKLGYYNLQFLSSEEQLYNLINKHFS